MAQGTHYLYLVKQWRSAWGLHLLSNDPVFVQEFQRYCRVTLDKKLAWFLQCNSREYQFFEFWNDTSHDLMLSEAIRIAEHFSCELHFDPPGVNVLSAITGDP